MSDLIDRQALNEYIRAQRGRPFIGITLEDAILMMISEVPSIEPERKKGKWTRHFDGNEWYWYCSSCKEQWYEEDLGWVEILSQTSALTVVQI